LKNDISQRAVFLTSGFNTSQLASLCAIPIMLCLATNGNKSIMDELIMWLCYLLYAICNGETFW